MNGLQSELLKYKGTLTRKLIVLFPLFFALKAIPGIWLMPPGTVRGWNLVLSMVFNMWTVVFLPLSMALFAALTDAQEKKAGNYRALRAHNVSPSRIWINKIAGMAVHTFLSTVVLIIATVVSGLITTTVGKWDIPWGSIIMAAMATWVTSLALIPIQLWAATWKGMFMSVGIGFVGMFIGVAAASGPYWIALPWSWATRLMCPLVGIHPNGVGLEAGSPLLDASVVPVGIIVSLIVLLVATALTAVWFDRRETK